MDVESSTNYKAHLNHRFSNEPNLMTSKKTALVIFKPLSYLLKRQLHSKSRNFNF